MPRWAQARFASALRRHIIVEPTPLAVPPDSFFVLGDNRDESQDSTTWKDPKTGERIFFIRKDTVKGRLMNVLE